MSAISSGPSSSLYYLCHCKNPGLIGGLIDAATMHASNTPVVVWTALHYGFRSREPGVWNTLPGYLKDATLSADTLGSNAT